MKKQLLTSKTQERVLLDESRLNNNIINLSAKSFLLEVDGGVSHLDKCKTDENIPVYLHGIIQSGDKPNRNGRIYPWEYLKRECIRYMENEVKNGLSYGEIDHPADSSTPMLANACWTIEDMSFKGTDVHAKIKVLNAYMPDAAPGKKIRGFILNGKNVGISSRALGSIEKYSDSEYDIVADDLEMVCWDAVSNASNYGSETLTLVESKKNIVKNNNYKGYLTESKARELSKTNKLILTESEKTFLNILGLEKFLQIYNK